MRSHRNRDVGNHARDGLPRRRHHSRDHGDGRCRLIRRRPHSERARHVHFTRVRRVAPARSVLRGVIRIRRVRAKVVPPETRRVSRNHQQHVWVLIVQKLRRFVARVGVHQLHVDDPGLRGHLARHRPVRQMRRPLHDDGVAVGNRAIHRRPRDVVETFAAKRHHRPPRRRPRFRRVISQTRPSNRLRAVGLGDVRHASHGIRRRHHRVQSPRARRHRAPVRRLASARAHQRRRSHYPRSPAPPPPPRARSRSPSFARS